MNKNILEFAKNMDGCEDKMKIIDLIPDEMTSLTIVDFGAGTGKISIEIAKRFPAYKIIAIEQEPDMIRILLENIQKEKLEKQITILPNISDFKEQSIDIFIFSAVLHEIENNNFNLFWSEISSFLKNKGKIIIRDRVIEKNYVNKTLKIKFTSKAYYEMAKEYYCIYWSKLKEIKFNDELMTIVGSYYNIYATLFAITWGQESFHLREKYEYPFIDSNKLPNNINLPDYLYLTLKMKIPYIKYNTIRHFTDFCNIIDNEFAPTNTILVYEKE